MKTLDASPTVAHLSGVVHSRRMGRTFSIGDIDPDTFTRIKNYDETVSRLDHYYGVVKRQLIANQSFLTGQFPESSAERVVSDVRTSLYCTFAIWCLHQAYKRIDDDRGKTFELGQSAVKCMRGILLSWMKQADKVERFKANQTPHNALHSKFHLLTGDEVLSCEQYNHLQIDVVSLYLLFLVQLTSSGLQIVFSVDEVSLVQNLVYYVERAYRTPDFGMWQRGSKYNNGSSELHASSIGLAKSALEAVNGCNLFGDKGGSQSVIYVDIDAHNRNRTIFETLLPRESSSTSSDMALLMAISFPAFGTHDQLLYSKTKSKIVKKLRGKHGFKRFARDGFGTVLEDTSSRFYKDGTVQKFERIESEWPLFYMYMIIEGVFRSDMKQVDEYKQLLRPLIHYDRRTDPTLPQYYFVPAEHVPAERAEPGSQPRFASAVGGPGDLFLWGQAMLVVTELLLEDLVHINEIDLIRRYLPSYNRPRRATRYSAFQGTASDLVVQVVLVAESRRLQAMLATYGVQSQTPKEVEPVQIWSQRQLVEVYRNLGVNRKLGLEGRPPRPIGALGTSKVYRISGQTVLCYPLIFDSTDFYLNHDMALLIDDIKSEVQFVGRYWRLSGRPTCCLIMKETHMRDANFRKMVDLLAMLKTGSCEGVKVRVGRLQNLMSSSCTEHLDFMDSTDDWGMEPVPFKELANKTVGYQSLTDIPTAIAYKESEPLTIEELSKKSDGELRSLWGSITTLRGRSFILKLLMDRHGPDHQLDGLSVHQRLVQLNGEAGTLRCWAVLRYCSSLLGRVVDSISPYLTAILVSGKQSTIGVIGHPEVVIDKPMTPAEIEALFFGSVRPIDVVQAVLQQEVVLCCGRLILTRPDLFAGILTIRIGWVLQAMELYSQIEGRDQAISEMAPNEVRSLLYNVLSLGSNGANIGITPRQQRQIDGCLGRSPRDLHSSVWFILGRTGGGLTIGKRHLPQLPTVTDMTVSELRFAILVNDMLAQCPQPELRQIVVQLIALIATILERNPELGFRGCIELSQMVDEAHALYLKDGGKGSAADLSGFFQLPPSATAGYLARAVVHHLLTAPSADADTTDGPQACVLS
ncbi:probable phosphorylase b kinase regulatory subunit beta isoform X2 [Pollicipes pollicipes]|uniref:probable phosphorylase b kinase regulatory subunit beta isoform X2 n=1 Tax=Pollicipes pollicipes TaxID=41117 RepID=UPI001884A9BC|nr:probable phosphorylase b kinase regulatory subunit beta isoform X2 [Pollicipes pollicipes]XP_037068092.1 probable phosphorylase b kinase regulatory subunit beta isoform X2 [Pollicipes pollicipes]